MRTAPVELDLAPLLEFTRVFEPLRDPEFLAQVRVNAEIGTTVWPNGADLCPDVLRHHLTGEPLPGQTDSTRRWLGDAGWVCAVRRRRGPLGWLEILPYGAGGGHAAGFSCTSIAIA